MNRFYRQLLMPFLLLGTHTLFAQSLQYINPPGLSVSKGYTQVVVTQGSRTAYISGQISANANGDILNKGDFRGQAKQVFENLKTALTAAGATFNDIIKLTYYVVNTDSEKISIVREIRGQYVTGPNPPASTYMGVQGLYDKDVLIEIEAVVALK
ncbi:RidA family protein [Spirosoma gilvum]